jgi:hypothetical protein
MILVPNEPPMSGAMTSTLNSGSPNSRASPFLIGNGAWVETHTRSLPVRSSYFGHHARASMGLAQLRSM